MLGEKMGYEGNWCMTAAPPVAANDSKGSKAGSVYHMDISLGQWLCWNPPKVPVATTYPPIRPRYSPSTFPKTSPLNSSIFVAPVTYLTSTRCHTNIPSNPASNPPPPLVKVDILFGYSHPFGCGHIHKKAPFPVRSTVVKLVRA